MLDKVHAADVIEAEVELLEVFRVVFLDVEEIYLMQINELELNIETS